MANRTRSSRSSGLRIFRHRSLIALEAMLVMGAAKDIIAARVLSSSLPNYGKVLFLMGATVGLFGGLYVIIQRLSARGVEGAHAVARALPLPFAYWVAHAGVLLGLYLLYAYMHGIKPL
jgi:hypothetical protein